MDIRAPVVAGSFYPAAPAQLRAMVEDALEAASCEHTPDLVAKALIVPHAGYLYSGPIAASGFRCLINRPDVRRIVLLGPAHYASFAGLALTHKTAFATPLGCMTIDAEAYIKLQKLPQVRVFERAHQPEHCLEVELPFLQRCLVDPKIVPILVGEAADEEVAEVVDLLWDGPETVFIISSDLSHFLEYYAAQELDAKTAASIEALDSMGIGPDQACGRTAIRGMLKAAKRRGLRARTVDLRNSGDTGGPRDRVVGYGAFALA